MRFLRGRDDAYESQSPCEVLVVPPRSGKEVGSGRQRKDKTTAVLDVIAFLGNQMSGHLDRASRIFESATTVTLVSVVDQESRTVTLSLKHILSY